MSKNVFWIFLLAFVELNAINRDSLWNVFNDKTLPDTIRIDACDELRMFYDESNADSSLIVSKIMFEFSKGMKIEKWHARAFFGLGYSYFGVGKYRDAITYYEGAIAIYKKIKRNSGLANCYNNIGLAHLRMGEYEQAFDIYLKAQNLYHMIKDTTKKAQIINQLAMVRDYQGRWMESLDLYYEALKVFEDSKNKYGQSVILLNIATIYDQMKDEKKAHEILIRSLNLKKEIEDEFGEAIILSILAGDYSDKGDYKTALEYLNKSLLIFEKYEEKAKIADAYCGIGRVYTNKGDLLKGLEFFKKGIVLQKQIELRTALGMSLNGMGELYIKLNRHTDAIASCSEGLTIAKETGNLDAEKANCRCLYMAYEKVGDSKQALSYYKKYIDIKDSLVNDENTREATRKEMNFGFSKKQLKDSLANMQQQQIKDLQLSEQEAAIKSERAQKIGLYLGLALLSILGAVSYRSYRIKKKDNLVIAAQKNEVEIQKAEITIQKHLVDEKQKEIVDSINYAKRIQYTLLANDTMLSENLKEYFVFFKPKDIVSGDFYWAAEHNDKFYLAACDSTGHGVPGAFMSLLNIGFLSEAIKEKNISDPHEILNFVRTRLIDSISKDEQKDGMDGILICVDKRTGKITYAAANNEPVLLKNNAMITLPKNKMPVGKGEKTDSFTLYTVDSQSGDILYLYTDGYADQFGGPKGKKFKYKPLNDMLLDINGLSLDKQKEILSAAFDKWKGNLEQVDDVLIIGIKC
ncbi:MAG: tetratricopeptide repeat protein [Bacteroidota bacterium]